MGTSQTYELMHCLEELTQELTKKTPNQPGLKSKKSTKLKDKSNSENQVIGEFVIVNCNCFYHFSSLVLSQVALRDNVWFCVH